MRWTTVVALLLADIEADSALVTLLGASPNMKLYKSGERDFEVPSLEWTLISEIPDSEVFDELHLQFDPFVRSEGDLETVHNRLYELFHRDTEWATGGVTFRSQFVTAQPQPAVDGVYSGPIEFTFVTVRQRYY